MLFGEPLLPPSVRGTENDASFAFRTAKVELVNHCADEFRGSEYNTPSFSLMPVYFAAVVAIFFDAKVSCADEFEPIRPSISRGDRQSIVFSFVCFACGFLWF